MNFCQTWFGSGMIYTKQNLCYLYEDESNETTSFLTMLSTWDKQELEQRLGQRVEFSKRAIGKLLQAFDRLLQRNEKMHQAVTDKATREVRWASDLEAENYEMFGMGSVMNKCCIGHSDSCKIAAQAWIARKQGM